MARAMTRGGLAGLTGLVLLVNACASTPPCVPVDVVVERKEERSRLRSEPVGLVTGGTDGRWYELNEPDWRAAEAGHTLTVCR